MAGDDTKDGPSAQYDVFLSHASEDKAEFVEPLYRALIKRGLTAWFDRAEIEWATIFDFEWPKALRNLGSVSLS